MWPMYTIDEFLNRTDKFVIDVRSPSEYAHAHIPGAVNLPLFTDAERAVVGTVYKREGHDAAVMMGLEIVGPKAGGLAAAGRELAGQRSVLLHCWRGGMRSRSMATLLETAGVTGSLLEGGYKSYRAAVQTIFDKPWDLKVLGGRTGSGKTEVLHALKAAGEQVVDLEGLAKHKGSAFGNLESMDQPSTEQFENLLFEELRQFDTDRPVWVEDESHTVGKVFVPDTFWRQMRKAPVVFLDIPEEARAIYLAEGYMRSGADPEKVEDALGRIRKRLGGQHFNAAVDAFRQGDHVAATRIVLVYYDKTYAYGLSTRESQDIQMRFYDQVDPVRIAKDIIK